MKYTNFNKDFSMGIKMDKEFTHGFLINLSASLKNAMVKIKHYCDEDGRIISDSKKEIFDDINDMYNIVNSLSSCYNNLDEIIMTDNGGHDDDPFSRNMPRFEVRFSKREDPNLHSLTFNFFCDCRLTEIFKAINASMVLNVSNVLNDEDLIGINTTEEKE